MNGDVRALVAQHADATARLGTIYYYLVLLPSTTSPAVTQILAIDLRRLVPNQAVGRFEYYHHQTFTPQTTEITMYDFVAERDLNIILGFSRTVPVNAGLMLALLPGVL